MGIFGMMHTSVSGMNAQANRLSAVADNVANASTIGYKKAITRFSDLVVNEGLNDYQSGGVLTHTSFDAEGIGNLSDTGDEKDLSIQGAGFFLVTDRLDGTGNVVLTRAGDFKPDKDGNLRNSAGFYLLSNDDNKSIVNIGSSTDLLQKAEVTTKITLRGHLPFTQKSVEHSTFDPTDPKSYTEKASYTVTGKHGQSVHVDVYFVKHEDGTWSMYAPKTISADTTPTKAADFTAEKLDFDRSNGDLKTEPKLHIKLLEDKGDTKGSDIVLNADLKNFKASGSDYAVNAVIDGHADGYYKSYTVDETGHVVVSLSNGQKIAKGQIQLAEVASPSNLLSASGTVFKRTADTGMTTVGYPGSGLFGSVKNQVLEQSNADIATELSDMIAAQRSYSANTKVFQAGSELMEALMNVVR